MLKLHFKKKTLKFIDAWRNFISVYKSLKLYQSKVDFDANLNGLF